LYVRTSGQNEEKRIITKLKGKMMKKILALVLVMTVSVMAVTFTGVDNGDGTVTISYDAPIVGLALDVDSTTVTASAVTLPDFFDVFMDYAYAQGASYVYGAGDAIATQDAAGVATLPSMSFCISAGGLEDDEADTVPATGSIVLAVTGEGDIEISANTLRGGVVDYNGAMTTNLPITITVASGDTPAQIEWDAMNANGDTFVNAGDISAIITYLNSNATAPLWRVPASEANAQYNVNGDAFVNAGDISTIITYLNSNASAPLWRVARPL